MIVLSALCMVGIVIVIFAVYGPVVGVLMLVAALCLAGVVSYKGPPS